MNGIRVTSKEAVGIVQSTLIGQVNPALVHQLNKGGIDAIGLSGYDGKLLTCTMLDEAVYGFVGEIQDVRTELIETLLQAGLFQFFRVSGQQKMERPSILMRTPSQVRLPLR